MNKKILLILILILLLSSCESVQRGLTGQKKNTSDEFLVEKKDPLVLPPSFKDLPNPDNVDRILKKKEEIETILLIDISDSKDVSTKNAEPTSVEKSILGKIRGN